MLEGWAEWSGCGVLELTRRIVGKKVWHHVYARNVNGMISCSGFVDFRGRNDQ